MGSHGPERKLERVHNAAKGGLEMKILASGTRIKVVGKHPWEGEVGIITAAPRKLHYFSKEEMHEVLLDKGFRCYAAPKNVKEI